MNYLKSILGIIAVVAGLKSIFTDSILIGSIASLSAGLFFGVNAWDSYKNSDKKNGRIFLIVTIILCFRAVLILI